MKRCERCRMQMHLCVCASLPRIRIQTRLVIVMHPKESHKTSNSGHLAALILEPSEVLVRTRDEMAKLPALIAEPGRHPLLLFPSESARPLDEVLSERPGPRTLIVPDGTWRQAKKVLLREPALEAVPAVRLPPGPPTRYALRSHPRPDGVSTLEAIARALDIIEGGPACAALEAAQALFVERVLSTRRA